MRLYPTLITIGILAIATGFFLRDEIALNKARLDADSTLQTGDIIFQSTPGIQGQAIQAATHSQWSHCGMIIKDSTGEYVLEGVQPVSVTPLSEFIKRGKGGNYAIKRLKTNSITLTDSLKTLLAGNGRKYVGRNYDIYFGWSDESLYCSELVWKVFKGATGIELGKLQKLSEFDLSSPLVKQQLRERYGNNIPYGESVISPEAIYGCSQLETIVQK